MYVSSDILKKWEPLLEHADLPKIKDSYRKQVTAALLENQEKSLRSNPRRQSLMEAGETPANVSADFGGPNSNNTTNISSFDSVMINMVRRNMPNMVAYDVCGVQPMMQPTQLIFALRAVTTAAADADLRDNPEAMYNEVSSAYSGAGTQAGSSPSLLNTGGTYTYGTGLATAVAEKRGTAGGVAFPEMGFTIEKVTVTAKERALKAQYTDELAQDLQAVHGMNAETILTEITQGEILAEINREVLRTLYVVAKVGSQNTDLTTLGTYDLTTDSDGRWSVERFKGMLFQIEREANQIARDTRRGKGNLVLCSSDVASALALAGVLDYAPALNTSGLEVDDAGNTFVGVLNGKYKVFVDPYAVPEASAQAAAGHNFFVVGYRGSNPLDAGFFYCPYVPLQLYKTRDSESFQPKLGFKTRYGMVANPFAEGVVKGLGVLTANANQYYRRSRVTNLIGT